MKNYRAMQEGRYIGALLRVPFLAFVDGLYTDLVAAGFDDFTRPHLAVFRHIDMTVGSRLIDLADEAQISKQSMDYLVDHLEACGYVQRAADPQDGRARRIQLTERGHQLMNQAAKTARQIELEWAADLGEERMQQLLSTLRDLTAILEQRKDMQRNRVG